MLTDHIELSLKTIEKKGLSGELHDIVRERTELQCVVADLEKLGESSGEKKEVVEKELKAVEKKIKDVGRQLEKARNDWQAAREGEIAERRLCVYSLLPGRANNRLSHETGTTRLRLECPRFMPSSNISHNLGPNLREMLILGRRLLLSRHACCSSALCISF